MQSIKFDIGKIKLEIAENVSTVFIMCVSIIFFHLRNYFNSTHVFSIYI